MQNLNIHFYNGKVFSLKVKAVSNKDLRKIFDTKELPGVYVIHDQDRTICVPCSQMTYLDFQPLSTNEPIKLSDDEMPF